MSRRGAFVRCGLRWGVLGLATLTALTAISSSEADARGRRKAHRAAAQSSYQPAYASIVVDVNSGQVLQASNADAIRHPASLTKIMTLYLLFERLEQGKIKLSSDIPISAHAASQAPSKLGLKPGESIRVESAIRAVVTKSANDIAVAVGEALAGDEPSFGRMMTAKARALGMNQTVYRNASGLPNDEQVTTARDQALLGRAIQDRFPQYYHYFATRSFEFHGKAMRNHNHLLGRIAGVDGIKTGYIRASGFNIVTSARRSGRHVVAVVFGGRTASARDARVVGLIENNINIASVKRTAPVIAEASDRAKEVKEAKVEPRRDVPVPAPAPQREGPQVVAAPATEVVREPLAVAVAAPELPREQLAAVAAAAIEPPSVGSTEPIKPNPVRTVTVQPGTMRTASLTPMPADSRKLTPAPAGTTASVTTVATVKGEAPPPPPGARPGVLGVLPAKGAKVASAGPNVPVPASAATEPAKPRTGGWMIQVGAFDDEKDAKQRLDTCQGKVKDVLAKADPFTEKVSKGEKALYRARFAGLDKGQAENACKQLKRGDIPCMLLKN